MATPDKNLMSFIALGTPVRIDGKIDGTVDTVSIDEGGVSYLTEWWYDSEIKRAYLQPSRLEPTGKHTECVILKCEGKGVDNGKMDP